MNNRTILVALMLAMCGLAFTATAQTGVIAERTIELPIIHTVPLHSWYGSNAMDAAIISTSLFKTPTEETKFTPPRFTIFLNIGTHFNYNFSTRAGFFTGITLKNMGLIRKVGDSTIKHRVYAAGIPLGLRFGNLEKKNFILLGGGVDFPINYREKSFKSRQDKRIFNEWGSDRVTKVMPYAFFGFQTFPGINLKIQYYPLNFFNPDFKEMVNGVSTQPYKGIEANLINVNVGFNIRYSNKITFRYYDRSEAGH